MSSGIIFLVLLIVFVLVLSKLIANFSSLQRDVEVSTPRPGFLTAPVVMYWRVWFSGSPVSRRVRSSIVLFVVCVGVSLMLIAAWSFYSEFQQAVGSR